MTTSDTTSNAAPVAAPEGHDAAMAAKFEEKNAAAPGQQPTTGEAPQRPAHIPEKFWNAEKGEADYEGLAKAYGELEAKQGKAPEQAAPADADAARTDLAAKGLDLDALAAEFSANGNQLKAETRSDLNAKGYTDTQIDQFIAGQVALATQIESEVFAVAGGADGYKSMVTWAAANLPKADIDAFDKAMDGDLGVIKLAVAGLNAKFLAANGQEPKLIGGGGGNDDGDVFTSVAQVTAAMRDPRYAKDSGYRAEVQAKVGRSNVL